MEQIDLSKLSPLDPRRMEALKGLERYAGAYKPPDQMTTLTRSVQRIEFILLVFFGALFAHLAGMF